MRLKVHGIRRAIGRRTRCAGTQVSESPARHFGRDGGSPERVPAGPVEDGVPNHKRREIRDRGGHDVPGSRPWTRQIRATALLPNPKQSASALGDQSVAPSSGTSPFAGDTWSTAPAGDDDCRPRRGAVAPTQLVPLSRKRLRHVRTECDATPKRRATSQLVAPSAASSSAVACTTARYGDENECMILSSSSRCSSFIRNGDAPSVLVILPT